MTPLISIIVPVYKVEEYLGRCIDSMISQTYTNLEIILIDDGSPDRCPQICEEYADRDNRIKVIHKKNGGAGFARNSGIEACTGDFVMFLDSDDYLSRDCVEVLYNRITEDNSDMVIGKHIDFYDDGRTDDSYCRWYTDCVLPRDELLEGLGLGKIISVSPWAKLYSRRVIKNITYPSLKCCEDIWVLVDILTLCNKISVTDHLTYYYYQREGSISRSMDDAKRIDLLYAYLRLVAYLAQEKKYKSAAYFLSFCINIALPIKKIGERRKYFKQYLDRKTRRILIGESSLNTKIKWYALFIPYANSIRNFIVKIKKKF